MVFVQEWRQQAVVRYYQQEEEKEESSYQLKAADMWPFFLYKETIR